MAEKKQQVPLPEVLQLSQPTNSTYSTRFPESICWGNSVVGGAVVAYAAKAAKDLAFSSKDDRMQSHVDVVQYAFTFLRPVFCTPAETVISFEIASIAKTNSVLHVQAKQNNKLCSVGYMTLSDLSAGPARWTQSYKYELSPPPPPAPSFDNMDAEGKWLSWLVPWHPSLPSQGQSYTKVCIPVEPGHPSILDQWTTPGWQEPGGAVWTDDSIHFLLDNCLPSVYQILDSEEAGDSHKTVRKAAIAQREARLAGKSDKLLGDFKMKPSGVIVSTTNITTEIKQRLQKAGEKWLFVRTTCKRIRNGRLDYVIDLLDRDGDVIAIAQHTMQLIQIANKFQRPTKI